MTSYRSNGELVKQGIPGLVYADDIVLLADNAEDLQKLADICGDEATYLGLHFSPQKSGVMVFNEKAHTAPLRIQQEAIPLVNYKYLGIWPNEGKGYLNAHEEHLKLKGKRNAAVMNHGALGDTVSTRHLEGGNAAGAHVLKCRITLKVRYSVGTGG